MWEDMEEALGELTEEDIAYANDRIQELLAGGEEEEEKESAGGNQKWRRLELVDLFPNLRL